VENLKGWGGGLSFSDIDFTLFAFVINNMTKLQSVYKSGSFLKRKILSFETHLILYSSWEYNLGNFCGTSPIVG
jgi:hypothetical protein